MPLASFLMMQLAFILLAILVFIFRGDAVDMLAIRIPAFIGLVVYAIVPFFIILSAISEKVAKGIVNFFIRIGGKVRLVKNVDEKIASADQTLSDYHTSLRMIAQKKGLLVKLFVFSLIYQIAICSIPFLFCMRIKEPVLDSHLSADGVHLLRVNIVPTPGNSVRQKVLLFDFSQLDYSGLFWAC